MHFNACNVHHTHTSFRLKFVLAIRLLQFSLDVCPCVYDKSTQKQHTNWVNFDSGSASPPPLSLSRCSCGCCCWKWKNENRQYMAMAIRSINSKCRHFNFECAMCVVMHVRATLIIHIPNEIDSMRCDAYGERVEFFSVLHLHSPRNGHGHLFLSAPVVLFLFSIRWFGSRCAKRVSEREWVRHKQMY